VPGWHEIIHVVIDAPFQQRGYGRQATQLAVQELSARPDCQAIVIAYNPANTVAQRLYESLGFTEVIGQNYDGDPLLKLSAR
jgi:diamine N-acetyltransferase